MDEKKIQGSGKMGFIEVIDSQEKGKYLICVDKQRKVWRKAVEVELMQWMISTVCQFMRGILFKEILIMAQQKWLYEVWKFSSIKNMDTNGNIGIQILQK